MFSLAEARGEDVIGVVLSGTGSDGAAGMRAVKASGGLTFAQDPATAKYTGMPQSAIDTDCVDWVLPPAEIAREIGRLVRTNGSIRPTLAADASPATMKTLLAKVHRYTKVDFSGYKESTVWRRILRRMAANQVATLEDYMALTRKNPDELGQLCKDILISVTSFFRDAEAFMGLREVLAERLSAKQPGDEIRIWVPDAPRVKRSTRSPSWCWSCWVGGATTTRCRSSPPTSIWRPWPSRAGASTPSPAWWGSIPCW